MTDEQKYLEVLKALGEIIANRNTDLLFKEMTIERLENRIKIAEAEVAGVQECKTK